MAEGSKLEDRLVDSTINTDLQTPPPKSVKTKSRNRDKDSFASKRRCVSTACIACRRRKSKCDGNTPSCAACSSVYGTECVYDPNSDHRRKGVYKKDIDNLKTRNSTLQTLIQAILNYPEDEVPQLIRQIRTCESLDDVAEGILAKDSLLDDGAEDLGSPLNEDGFGSDVPKFETELSGKMGELRLENGSVQVVGGTSNLVFLGSGMDGEDPGYPASDVDQYPQQGEPITSWTTVTSDPELILHLLNMYFTWHYAYFTTLSKSLFYRDFCRGKPSSDVTRKTEYCTPLLVNAMLTLGCHFTSWPASRADPHDSATAGDHFFKEGKRLILENDEHENPRLATVQALALMSVREAGCGREAKGWVYSGMSFRMACDLGLNVDSGTSSMDEQEIDARRITFWGCFLFDKCWSNYLGRPPQLPLSNITVPKFDVFPTEDSEPWSHYTDSGVQANNQPSRTRAIALQISLLCEISSDLLLYFYHPTNLEKAVGKQAELKKLSELHTRLEAWRKQLPKEMEARDGQLPNVLVMHMFFQLLFIHLFRPFLKYNQASSPLPAHVSPRKLCTHAATMISKLLRLYKRNYGLRQICNIAVYIAHSACTIHLLNLPDKNARRDIVHGLKHLEEIADSWLCSRRTLSILSLLVRRWKVELPEEAVAVLARTNARFSNSFDHQSPKTDTSSPGPFNKVTLADVPKSDLTYKPSTNGYPMSATSIMRSIAAEEPPLRGVTPLPPSVSTDFNSAAQNSRFAISHGQRDLWNQDRASRGTSQQAQTSPSALFGGVDSLIEESQDWWLKDQSALAVGFDNWHGMESEAALLGNDMANGLGNSLGNNMGNGLGNSLGNDLRNGLRNGVNEMGNGIGSGKINANGYMGYGTTSYGYSNANPY